MKTLVVYYSRTGNTKKVGDQIARLLKADIEQISTTDSRKGFIGYLKSGREAMRKKPAQIKESKKDPAKYDLTLIGSPVWGWNLCSPIRAYLEEKKDSFKKVAFFCTMGGSGDKRTFKVMADITSKKPKSILSLTEKELKEDYKKKLKTFTNKLK